MKMKLGPQFRELSISQDAINEGARTVELSFSSEFPVDRGWGLEVLDHGPDSVRLGRLNDGGAVLVNHNTDDQVGVVERAFIGDDRVGRAVLRFGRSQRAGEVFQDLVDGIRRLVSVGYRIHEMKREEKRGEKDEPDSFRVTSWEPFEISLVPIPADPTVGVGRSDEEGEQEVTVIQPETRQEERKMSDQMPAPVNIEAVKNEAREAEQARVREILAVGQKHGRDEAARAAVAGGMSADQFRAETLESLGQIKKAAPAPEIGLSDNEKRQFSFLRAINALANPSDRRAQEAAGFEREVSEAAKRAGGVDRGGLRVPMDVLAFRDLTTSTGSGTSKAGYTVATDLVSFIDVLRNRMVLQSLGATYLMGLQGNVAIPRKSAGATAYWVAENAAPTEGSLTFEQVSLSPKTVAAFVDYSRRLAIQSSQDVEAMVRNDLAASIAREVDSKGINGSGASNQPTGILSTTGIGSVTLGTNGAAPTWAMVVDLVKEVEIDNADVGSLAYLTNPKVKAKLAQTARQGSGVEGNFILQAPFNNLFGYNVAYTNAVPSNLSKGSGSNLSAAIFGNWNDLLVGFWSGIDLLVDPYTGSSAATMRVTAFQDVDVAVRHPESFSECNEIIA